MKIPSPRTSTIQRFLASMAAALLVSASAHGTEDLAGQPPVPLISRDKALPVIIPENAPPHTRAAANFLADTIKKIGGVRPEVLEKLPDPMPAGAVWVGYQPAMDALFPGVDFMVGKIRRVESRVFRPAADGTRGTHLRRDPQRTTLKLCEGEPEVWNTWLREQKEHLAKFPLHTILEAMPNDGYFDGHCIDPRSRAWDPDPSETDV